MIQIYGSPRSSAGRCYVMLEECGLKYQVMPLDMAEKREHKAEAYLKMNPNGKVPVLVDNGFVLWESAAILFYLADKYKPEMLGATPEERALIHQWTFWAMTEAQPPLVDILIQKVFVPEEKRDHGLVERRQKQAPSLLRVMDQEVSKKKYLVGDKYTVADVAVASTMNLALGLGLDLSSTPHLRDWLQNIKERPAWQKIAKERGE